MEHPEYPRRRALLALGGGLLAACAGTPHASEHPGEHPGGQGGEDDISATEDLMREHGVLRRVFTVYDESARRLRAGTAVDPALIARAARVIRNFAEDYHERAEERWVFPPLQALPAVAPTVAVLIAQHARGRQVTAAVLALAATGPAPGTEGATRLAALCEMFNRMYRPHAAWEDTVAFPALRGRLSHHALEEMGEQMEQAEHATVGEGGFERAVTEVAAIEHALGLDDLSRFNPPAP